MSRLSLVLVNALVFATGLAIGGEVPVRASGSQHVNRCPSATVAGPARDGLPGLTVCTETGVNVPVMPPGTAWPHNGSERCPETASGWCAVSHYAVASAPGVPYGDGPGGTQYAEPRGLVVIGAHDVGAQFHNLHGLRVGDVVTVSAPANRLLDGGNVYAYTVTAIHHMVPDTYIDPRSDTGLLMYTCEDVKPDGSPNYDGSYDAWYELRAAS